MALTIDPDARDLAVLRQDEKPPRREFARFLLVGTFAALVNLLCRYLFDRVMGYSPAILLAYLCGMVTAFALSKVFVFQVSRLSTATEFVRFTLVNVAAVIQVWAVSVFLADWLLPRLGVLHHAYAIAHLIGVAVPVFTSYLGHKHFSFASRTANHRDLDSHASRGPHTSTTFGAK